MESLTIRELIEQIEGGQLRIPAFQRGFVWDPERVAHLMDSVYKSYPFGALLFWRTKEALQAEKKLGPFELPPHKEDYPIDYVLDGQQRVTSLYATFQTSQKLDSEESWKDIYFDLNSLEDVQDTQFFALTSEEAEGENFFPLNVVFDTVEYRKATKDFDDKLAAKVDTLQSRFKEVRVPVQIFRTDDKGTVAVIFERINRQGVPLDTLQLLSAWTWSEDFQLQAQFAELIDEIEDKGFDVNDFDENLLLKCASAILVSDPKPEAIVELAGETIRSRFDEVLNGILGALDFLSANFNIRQLSNLPYQTMLVPLSVFFAITGERQIIVTDEQRKKLVRWFWRASFGRRYSRSTTVNMADDIKAMLQLKGGQNSELGNFSFSLGEEFFKDNQFGMRNVNTKTFILMLAINSPRSFISGQPVDLTAKLKSYNKTEFHHLMPRAFMKDKEASYGKNCLANFSFLSRSENKNLGGVAPSEYKKKMPDDDGAIKEILESQICSEVLFDDDFDKFIEVRSSELLSFAENLIGD